MRNGYRSTPGPTFAASVARALSQYGLAGVPGFYKQGDRWLMVNPGQGIMIPIRDQQNNIKGFQVRRDEGQPKYIWFSSANKYQGTSSGAPIHFAKPDLIDREVLITEGALKADTIAHLLGVSVVAAAGVNNFQDNFADLLKQSFPSLRKTIIAFDADFKTKPQVKEALIKLRRMLCKVGFEVSIRVWPIAYKGFDDYLNRGSVNGCSIGI